jgi:hypothetical protein
MVKESRKAQAEKAKDRGYGLLELQLKRWWQRENGRVKE